jgi:hypothetical protein
MIKINKEVVKSHLLDLDLFLISLILNLLISNLNYFANVSHIKQLNLIISNSQMFLRNILTLIHVVNLASD